MYPCTVLILTVIYFKISINADVDPVPDQNSDLQVKIEVLENLTNRLEAIQRKMNNSKRKLNLKSKATKTDVNKEINIESHRSTTATQLLNNNIFTTNKLPRRNRKRTKYHKFNDFKDGRKHNKQPFITLPPEEFAKALTESDFGPLHTVMSNDPKPELVGDHEFNFMGRLIPAIFATLPTLCTVVNIKKRIFVSSARCIYGLTVQTVHVDYVSTYVKTMAFLFSEHPTVRMYDEVGIIVTEESHIEPPEWHPIPFFDKPRQDDQYKWFDDLRYEYIKNPIHYVIGYYQNMSRPQFTYELRRTDVFVGLNFCHDVFGKRLMRVPCFAPCKFNNPEEYLKPNPKCRPYLAGEGFAIIDKRRKRLFGIASWGIGGQNDQLLPAGLAVPNSKTFIENYGCAERIIKDNQDTVEYTNLTISCHCYSENGCHNQKQ